MKHRRKKSRLRQFVLSGGAFISIRRIITFPEVCFFVDLRRILPSLKSVKDPLLADKALSKTSGLELDLLVPPHYSSSVISENHRLLWINSSGGTSDQGTRKSAKDLGSDFLLLESDHHICPDLQDLLFLKI